MSQNFVHPELRSGEHFMGNFASHYVSHLKWISKRPGFVAYDSKGNLVDDTGSHVPVFVSDDEYQKIKAARDLAKK